MVCGRLSVQDFWKRYHWHCVWLRSRTREGYMAALAPSMTEGVPGKGVRINFESFTRCYLGALRRCQLTTRHRCSFLSVRNTLWSFWKAFPLADEIFVMKSEAASKTQILRETKLKVPLRFLWYACLNGPKIPREIVRIHAVHEHCILSSSLQKCRI